MFPCSGEDEPDNANATETFNYIENKAKKLQDEIAKRQPVISKHKKMTAIKREQMDISSDQSIRDNGLASLASKSASDVSLAESELTDVLAKKQGALKELRILQEAAKKNRDEIKSSEEEMKERIKRYEMDILNLEKKTDQVRLELELKSSKLKQAELKLENKLALNTSKVDAIINENGELKFKLESLESTKSDLELEFQSQTDKFSDELKAKNSKIDTLTVEIEELSTQNEELEKEISFIQQNNSNAENEFKEVVLKLQMQIGKLNEEMQSKNKEIISANAKNQELENNFASEVNRLKKIVVEKDQENRSVNEKQISTMSQKVTEINRMKELMAEAIQVLKSAKLNEDENESINVEFIVHEAKLFKRDRLNMAKEIDRLNNELNELNKFVSKIKGETSEREQNLKKTVESLSDELRLKNIKLENEASDFERREKNLKLDLEKAKNELDLKLLAANETFQQKVSNYEAKIEKLHLQLAENIKDHHEKINQLTISFQSEKENLERTKNEEISRMSDDFKNQSEQDINKIQDNASSYYHELNEVTTELKVLKKSEDRIRKELNALEKTVDVEIENACKVLSSVMGLGLPVTFPPFGNVSNRIKDILSKLALLRALVSELRGYVDNINQNSEQLRNKVIETEQKSRFELQNLEKRLKQDKNEAMAKVREEIIDEYLTQIEELRKLIEDEKNVSRKIRCQLREKDEQIHSMKISMNDWKMKTMNELEKTIRDQIEVEIESRIQRQNLVRRELLNEKEREAKRLSDQVLHLNSRIQTLSNPSVESTEDEVTRNAAIRLIRQLQKKNRQLQQDNMQLRLKERTSYQKTSNLAEGCLSANTASVENFELLGSCVKKLLDEDRKKLAASMSDLTIYGV